MDQETKLNIANDIYLQLGGRRFTILTGSRPDSILEDENGDLGLTFKLTRNASKANRMRVIYKAGEDLYTVIFYRLTRKGYDINLTEIKNVGGVYCDQLAPLFQEVTGLVTEFPRFVCSK